MNFLTKTFSKIKTEVSNHTLWLTLNDPENANALDLLMIDEFISVLEEADRSSEVRVIVITGEGKHFCSGGNIKAMESKTEMFSGEANELRENYMNGIQRIPRAMSALKTPTIAMVNGAAIGAGLDLACMCDIRTSSESAKFGETFTSIGLVPGDGGTYFLQRVVGFSKAMEMSLTADVYSADEALKMGLVSQVFSNESLKNETKKMSDKISSRAPIATQMTKKAIIHGYTNDLNSQLDLLSAFQAITQRSSDHFEALTKVKKKETPDFKHR